MATTTTTLSANWADLVEDDEGQLPITVTTEREDGEIIEPNVSNSSNATVRDPEWLDWTTMTKLCGQLWTPTRIRDLITTDVLAASHKTPEEQIDHIQQFAFAEAMFRQFTQYYNDIFRLHGYVVAFPTDLGYDAYTTPQRRLTPYVTVRVPPVPFELTNGLRHQAERMQQQGRTSHASTSATPPTTNPFDVLHNRNKGRK
jgi:hypothetical protein